MQVFDTQAIGIFAYDGGEVEALNCEVGGEGRGGGGVFCSSPAYPSAVPSDSPACTKSAAQCLVNLTLKLPLYIHISLQVFGSREKHGVSAQGKGSTVFMKGGKVSDCCLTGALALDAGALELQGVAISGQDQTDGVAVCGKDSKCRLEKCSVVGVVKVGVFATEGGTVEIIESEVRDCQQLYGVYVKGGGSVANLTGTKVVDCNEIGVFVAEGGEASLGQGCQVLGVKAYHGIYVRGAGSYAEVAGEPGRPVMIRDCASSGMVVAEAATAVIRHAVISGSQRLHGVEVTGAKSEVSISDCRIHTCRQVGAVAAQGAMLHMSDSEVRH